MKRILNKIIKSFFQKMLNIQQDLFLIGNLIAKNYKYEISVKMR